MKKEECQIYRERLVALAEDPVGSEAEPGLLAHLRQCPGCDAEYRWLTGLCAELEAAGDAIGRNAPAVDLTDSVMSEVARLKRPQLVELPIARRRTRWARPKWARPSRAQIGWAAVSAAAAAAIVAAVLFADYGPATPAGPTVAGKTSGPATPTDPGSENLEMAQAPAPGLRDPIPGNPFQNLIDDMRPAGVAPSETAPGTLASFDVHEVVATRKQAATDPAARLQLAQWATVAAERAKELAANEEATLTAKVGAAGSLPPDEAQRVLMAAVEADPDNPYLRHALGAAFSQRPEDAPKAAAEFAAQTQLDPENALGWYELAASLLEQGDPESAAGALDTARSLAAAHPYTLESAGYQERALVETGVADDVAQLLVALTAGTSQYGDLLSLGSELLDYGKYYEQSGQTELAEDIYDSVRVLGTQLADTAVFSNELLAGLDIQRDAISVLSGLVQFMEQAENVDMLARQTQQVVQSLNSIGTFFTSVNTFFDGDPGTDAMRMFSQFVLGNGDLGVLDFLFNQQARQ